MDEIYESLVTRALDIRLEVDSKPYGPSRTLIALAGVPGAGKSTIAREVVERLNRRTGTRCAAVLPMDGFHFSRADLDKHPDSAKMYARRGAPWTFDAQGVVNLVRQLDNSRKDGTWRSKAIMAPAFDHVTKDPVLDAIAVSSDTVIVILEGNWILLDEEPWSAISGMVDDTWFLDADARSARDRVAKRHIQSGIEHTWDDAVRRAEYNDLPNGELARTKLMKPKLRIISIEEV